MLRPAGVLAIWCYELCAVTPQCDELIDKLYRDIVGNYWPPERAMVEEGYASVQMPGTPIALPALDMNLEWQAADMLGYLRTWSACQRFEAERGRDPVNDIATRLVAAWGPVARRVSWPLRIRACRPNTLPDLRC